MNNATSCNLSDAPRLAERYVSRRMSEAESVGFEDHFVACADCQREVRLASAIREGVREQAVAATVLPRTSRVRPARWIGAGVALAAGIAAIAILRPAPSASLAALGGVLEPPVYLGVAVRGTTGPGDSVFDRAMNAYAARKYPAAADGLRAALAAGQDSVPTEFFLAASLLLSGNARSAAATFNRVVNKGVTPYLDESQLYEAKALLRLGRGRQALEALARHHPSDPVLAGVLSALSDSVTRAIAR
jgi:hypothetical protein